MSEPAGDPVPPDPKDQGKQSLPPEPQDNDGNVVTMSKADFEAFKKGYDDRLAGMSAKINRLEKAEKKEDSDGKPKPTSVEQEKAVKDMQEQLAKFQNKQDRANAREAKHVLRSILEGKKMSSEQADHLADILYRAHRDHIVFDDDDTPMFKEAEDKVSGLGDWFAAYIETPAGSAFLPVKRAPNVPPGDTAPSPSGKRYYTRADAEAGRVDPADIMSGKAVLKE